MSDENINPQDVLVKPQGNNLKETSLPFKSKKAIIILFLIIVFIIISLSLFLFFMQKNGNNLPQPIPTISQSIKESSYPNQQKNEIIITIRLEETRVIPNTAISLTYSSKVSPEEDCNDCGFLDIIEAKNIDQSKTLNFSCGGITDECFNKQEAFSYDIEVIDRSMKDALKFRITKK